MRGIEPAYMGEHYPLPQTSQKITHNQSITILRLSDLHTIFGLRPNVLPYSIISITVVIRPSPLLLIGSSPWLRSKHTNRMKIGSVPSTRAICYQSSMKIAFSSVTSSLPTTSFALSKAVSGS